jgi:hypothetical protein
VVRSGSCRDPEVWVRIPHTLSSGSPSRRLGGVSKSNFAHRLLTERAWHSAAKELKLHAPHGTWRLLSR